MNPETIKPDFLDRYNLDRRYDALLGSALQPGKRVSADRSNLLCRCRSCSNSCTPC
jgi:hypothetical protein